MVVAARCTAFITALQHLAMVLVILDAAQNVSAQLHVSISPPYFTVQVT